MKFLTGVFRTPQTKWLTVNILTSLLLGSEFALYDDNIFDDKDDFQERYYGNNEDELCEKFNYEPNINRYTVARGQYTEDELVQNSKNEAKLNEYLEKLSEKIFKKAIVLYVGPLDANDI